MHSVGGRRIVHGTPITPAPLLESLRGSSFCVSFADPRDLDRCIELVGDDEILILDNGAFTIWRTELDAKRTLPRRLQFEDRNEYRAAFWDWANEAQSRCPQAVAVIPDVIGGTEEENLIEMSHALRNGLAEYPERTMSIWHLDESFDQLATHLKLCNFVGLGSCEEYDVVKKRAAYLEQVEKVRIARDAIAAAHGRKPWVHLMRGLGVFHELAWADSADSCNVARNHSRHRQADGADRVARFAARIEAPIQEAAAKIPLAAA